MDFYVRSIGMFRRLTAPRHTASKTRRCFASLYSRHKAEASQEDKPPSRGSSLYGLLNAILEAVGYTHKRKTGRFVIFRRITARCRSPPPFSFENPNGNGGDKLAQYNTVLYERLEHTAIARKAYREFERADALDEAEAEAEWIRDKKRLGDALATLTPRQREVYVLKAGHLLTEAQIAERLGISQSAVSQFFNSAKKRLEKFAVKSTS